MDALVQQPTGDYRSRPFLGPVFRTVWLRFRDGLAGLFETGEEAGGGTEEAGTDDESEE